MAIISNRIDQTFGAVGTFTGGILLLVGILTINSWAGVVLVLVGSLFTFSYTGTRINTDTNMLKQYTKLFGLFMVGDWESMNPYTSITVLKNNSSSTISSQSNRRISSKPNNYLVYMLSDDLRLRIPILKIKTKDGALQEARILSEKLVLPLIDFTDNPKDEHTKA